MTLLVFLKSFVHRQNDKKITCESTSGQGLPVDEGERTIDLKRGCLKELIIPCCSSIVFRDTLQCIVYLVLVIFVRRSPHWQEDLSQGDQGETRQSTGQSMLQDDDNDDENYNENDDDGGGGGGGGDQEKNDKYEVF